MLLDQLLEKEVLPNFALRLGIRRLLAQRLDEEGRGGPEAAQERLKKLIAHMETSPIAVQTKKANQQHYEVPAEFYKQVLGPHLKYSSAYWPQGTGSLADAEQAMLALSCQRARLKNDQRILELGCGWGSLSLYMAKHLPRASILGVSNSHSQRQFIMEQAKQRGLRNLQIVTADMNHFATTQRFDRIVSVEMFEHMRNWPKLLSKVASWLKPGGLFFAHVFTHRNYAYYFEEHGPDDWMGRHFFSGGLMPSDSLFLYFQDDLQVKEHWHVDGTHYQKTSRAWLKNHQKNKKRILQIFENTYGRGQGRKWWMYWKIFFMACEELWGYAGGKEWLVSHYLFKKRKAQ